MGWVEVFITPRRMSALITLRIGTSNWAAKARTVIGPATIGSSGMTSNVAATPQELAWASVRECHLNGGTTTAVLFPSVDEGQRS